MDLILFLEDYFEYIIKKHETIADNPRITNRRYNVIIRKFKKSY